mmetsp:Transcript_2223/g.5243  ORF Transcript_2223/g.5243 Transcript_2223/m.5243 type:complete len:228 (+) Transcript_2223:452-1135(+)
MGRVAYVAVLFAVACRVSRSSDRSPLRSCVWRRLFPLYMAAMSSSAIAFSSLSSAAVASISPRERSSMVSPGTMVHSPPTHVTGKEYMSPASIPYAPSPPGDTTPIETHVPAGVPLTQSRTWSHTDDAAESAEDSLRAAMMAAPRCCTVAMNSPFRYASSPMASRMGTPPASPWLTSGYCVEEWLPQIMQFLTSRTGTPVFCDTCPSARLWSRRVRQVTFLVGILGA